MRAIDEVQGLDKETFDQLYDATKGFQGILNTNHPECKDGETFFSFLNKGAEALVRENSALVAAIQDNF